MVSPERIAIFHKMCVQNLNNHFNRATNKNYDTDFLLKTSVQIQRMYQEKLKYIDSVYILELVACCESYFRYEYMFRSTNRMKDELSKKLQILYAVKRERAHFSEDLLHVWKDYLIVTQGTLNQFYELIRYRDWLAHGRYWNLRGNLDLKYGYQTVYNICYALIDSIRNNTYVDYSVISKN